MELSVVERTVLGYYCDVLTPLERTLSGHWLLDLLLDVWTGPDGRARLLDEDAFAAVVQAGALAPAGWAPALETVAGIDREQAAGRFPGRSPCKVIRCSVNLVNSPAERVGRIDRPIGATHGLAPITAFRRSLMASSPNVSAAADRQVFRKTVTISASPERVWSALTDPAQMRGWMFSSPIDVSTDWAIGGPIVMCGDLHGVPFTNKGIVLAFEPVSLLRYSHLNSVSQLPDVPESYATIEFVLTPDGHRTTLATTVAHCPTDVIFKHLVFYWTVTLDVLQRRLADADRSGG